MRQALFTLIAVFLAVLGTVLLLAPAKYLSLYTVYSPTMDFPAQRFAPALLAWAGVLWIARKWRAKEGANQLAVLAAVTFVAVALTGIYHWVAGVAGPAILVAAGIEFAVAAALLLAVRQGRED